MTVKARFSLANCRRIDRQIHTYIHTLSTFCNNTYYVNPYIICHGTGSGVVMLLCLSPQNPLQFGDSDCDSSEAECSDATIRNNKPGAPPSW